MAANSNIISVQDPGRNEMHKFIDESNVFVEYRFE